MQKEVCSYCQTPVKNEDELFFCPSCNSPYHKECWFENGGCAVYGCNQKSVNSYEINLRDTLVNAEYLINQNKYTEALALARKYLRTDDNSTELKVLYNKAVTLINNKHKLLEGGDNAYLEKDFSSAEVFYKNALQYCDEDEKNIVNTKLEILGRKIPEQKRSALVRKSVITFLVFLIIGVCGFAFYYFYYLEEDREFAEIEKSESYNDIRSMELSIERYEKFANRFKEGHLNEKALDKINLISYSLANKILDTDWRNALKYYNKINHVKDSKSLDDLYKAIYENAESELGGMIVISKKMNSLGKFTEAKDELENALKLIDYFPGETFMKEFNLVKDNIGILNKKISLQIKVKNIDKEIDETIDKLKYSGSALNNKNQTDIFGIINEMIKPDVYSLKTINPEKIVAVKITDGKKYRQGELVNFTCTDKGYINSQDDGDGFSVPYYEQAAKEPGSDSSFPSDKETMLQRLKYLKSQKEKADSVLNLKLRL
ncbi:MAG: hypothetical protein JSS63_03920 [Bacteroidetes bacterium]|nr:hypothetical protein [Bacteroidota bacterium]